MTTPTDTEIHAVHSDQTEAVLSSMLLQPSAAKSTIAFGITKEDFFDTRNAALFGLFDERIRDGKGLDYAACWDEIDRRRLCNYGYFVDIFSFCVTGSNWKEYCEILREYTIGRRALKVGFDISEAASDPGLVREIGDISRSFVESMGAMESTKLPPRWDEQVEAAYGSLTTEETHDAFPFGILELDRALRGGAVRGELVIVAGDTGRGKSILLGMAAVEAATHGHGIAYYSLEMPDTEVILRMFSALMRRPMISATELQTEGDRQAASEARSILKESRISLRGDLFDIDEIVLDAEAKVVSGKADVVIIDYLQLCHCTEGDNRSQTVAAVSRKLRRLSSRGCAVFAASQVNDAGKVFESRAISHDANVIIGIGAGRHGPQLSVIKNRRGRTDVCVDVTLRGEISRFE